MDGSLAVLKVGKSVIFIMEQEILRKLEGIEKKLEDNAEMIRRMKQYFFWTLIVSVLVIVLPLLGLLLVIPRFIDTYSNLGI
jgi:type II secretory pathway component PulF